MFVINGGAFFRQTDSSKQSFRRNVETWSHLSMKHHHWKCSNNLPSCIHEYRIGYKSSISCCLILVFNTNVKSSCIPLGKFIFPVSLVRGTTNQRGILLGKFLCVKATCRKTRNREVSIQFYNYQSFLIHELISFYFLFLFFLFIDDSRACIIWN